MTRPKVKILLIVEGEKTEPRIMQHLLDVFGISDTHEIVSYKNNLYDLYRRMFYKNKPEDYDLLQVLKESALPERKWIFDEDYSDILLIFDLDPQDPFYSSSAVEEMLVYFCESSDMGKLYINYPMAESYYHMKTIPDPEYLDYFVSVDDLSKKKYKAMVGELRRYNYDSYARTKRECIRLIKDNMMKADALTGQKEGTSAELFAKVALYIKKLRMVPVLCTCVFHIYEYNPKLLNTD